VGLALLLVLGRVLADAPHVFVNQVDGTPPPSPPVVQAVDDVVQLSRPQVAPDRVLDLDGARPLVEPCPDDALVDGVDHKVLQHTHVGHVEQLQRRVVGQLLVGLCQGDQRQLLELVQL